MIPEGGEVNREKPERPVTDVKKLLTGEN